MADDAALLGLYANRRDAEAFSEIVKRHAGMVYATCLRILRDPHDADDVAQECFLELTRRAAEVTSSLPGWLHFVATSRSLNAIRSASTRRRHEGQAMADRQEKDEPTWADVQPHVDEALEELPEELRAPLVMHYLEGSTQAEVAEAIGANQSTISRRLEKGVAELRETLRKAGVVASVAVVATLLAENAAAAPVPPALVASLGKMAIAGVGRAAAASSAAAGILSALQTKVIAGLIIVLAAAGVGVAYVMMSERELPVTPADLAPAARITVEPKDRRTAGMRPDYSTLELAGDDHSEDSFSLTMRAVAKLFGRNVDYETVYALSCNGFAPGIHPPEGCKSFWLMHGRGQNLDLVAAYLGLNLRYMGMPEPEEIRDALAKGEVVITEGGWLNVIYCHWGILLEAPEGGPIKGATQSGRKDDRLDHIRRCWAVTLGKPTLTQEQADVLMLERALARIRGDREPFLPDFHIEVIWGLAAMDLWIRQMEKPHYQEDDPGSSYGNATCAALYSYEGAKDTAAYLRKRLDSFAEESRPYVESVAERYERVEALLKPFAVDKGYEAFIGDQAKQVEHANKVLRPVKGCMAAAALATEQALQAVGIQGGVNPKIKRKGSRVWIEGVPEGDVGAGGEFFVKGITLMLRHRGEETSLGEVTALSGEAFNFCYGSNWHGSSHLMSPTDVLANVANAYGYEYQWLVTTNKDDPRAVDKQYELRLGKEGELALSHWTLDQIFSQVAAGRPVMVGGGADATCETWSVVVGYDAGKREMCHVGIGEPYRWAPVEELATGAGYWVGRMKGTAVPGSAGGFEANPAFILGAKSKPVGKEAAHRAALKRAVDLFRASPHQVDYWGGVTFYFGKEAYSKLAEALEALDYHEDTKKPKPEGAYNWYAVDDLGYWLQLIVKGRNAAIQFCEKSGAILPEAKAHLDAAAKAYREEVSMARSAFPMFVDWDENAAHAWLSDRAKCARGASVIREMLAKERTATGEIERALASKVDEDLDDQQRRGLGQWSNLFGSLDKCIEAADSDPELHRLLKLELSLDPVSDGAEKIRSAMGRLEPAEITYLADVEALVSAIGKGAPVTPDHEALDKQKARALSHAAALKHWLAGKSPAEARNADDTDVVSADAYWHIRNKNDDGTRQIISLIVEKLETGDVDAAKIEELRKDEKLGGLADRIGMLDVPLWSFDHNYKLLITSVAVGKVIGEWHKPIGSLAWGDGNPADELKVRAVAASLEAWLRDPRAKEKYAEALGKPDAYKEKVWLARCLLVCLRHHLANYYPEPPSIEWQATPAKPTDNDAF